MKKKKLKRLLREAQLELAQIKEDGWVHCAGTVSLGKSSDYVETISMFHEPLLKEQSKGASDEEN